MQFISSIALATLVAFAQAQTPEGFVPKVDTKLEVIFNSTSVSTPGQMLTKAATANAPQLAVAGMALNSSDTFMFVMIDLDVSMGGSAARTTILHAMETGFKATQQTVMGTAQLLATTVKGPAAYFGPGPPATDATPHRYVELLFRQPATLSVRESDFAQFQSRIGFDITAFMTRQGLSTPIAANFFRVSGRSNNVISGTATGTGGIVRNTLQPFEGAVGKVDMSRGLAGLLGGLALLAV